MLIIVLETNFQGHAKVHPLSTHGSDSAFTTSPVSRTGAACANHLRHDFSSRYGSRHSADSQNRIPASFRHGLPACRRRLRTAKGRRTDRTQRVCNAELSRRGGRFFGSSDGGGTLSAKPYNSAGLLRYETAATAQTSVRNRCRSRLRPAEKQSASRRQHRDLSAPRKTETVESVLHLVGFLFPHAECTRGFAAHDTHARNGTLHVRFGYLTINE